MQDKKYFAAKDPIETSRILLGKASDWRNILTTNGFLDKLRTCWAAYHGAFYGDVTSGHTITFVGEQGELAQLPVNHVRNLGQHMLVMTTASRPSMEARAANTDFKSLAQVTLANGLLDYYMREKRLERHIRAAVEHAIVLGAGYIKMEWDATAGKIVDEDEETGVVIHEGDVKYSNLSAFDVVFDVNREDFDHDWILVRTWKNKYDLAAKYPEYSDKIKNLDTKDAKQRYSLQIFRKVDSDEIEVWTFYHKRSDSMPEGRELVFLSEDIIIQDQPLPYRKIPIFRISPNEIMGTSFGYSNLFDLLPLQEAVNQLYSTIMSNQTAFGVQNIFVKTGSNVNITNLSGGLNVIEGLEKPEVLNLLATAPETFQFLQMIEAKMETISGVSSVTRGAPDPAQNLRSGNALALVQSMALQFISGLQNQYVCLIEDLGTGLIELLQDYASAPRVASIIGKGNKAYLKEFKSSDLSEISRVIVDVGNPLSRTTAGRVQMAEQLMQMKPDSFSIEQYIQVINTGRLEVMTDDSVDQENLIQQENERLMEGIPTKMLDIDDHILHIKKHRTILSEPTLRDDDEKCAGVLKHIQDHIDAWKQTDGALLAALGQQPAPQAPAAPPQNSGGESPVGQVMGPPEQTEPQQALSEPATPPAPFEGLPTSAAPQG